MVTRERSHLCRPGLKKESGISGFSEASSNNNYKETSGCCWKSLLASSFVQLAHVDMVCTEDPCCYGQIPE